MVKKNIWIGYGENYEQQKLKKPVNRSAIN